MLGQPQKLLTTQALSEDEMVHSFSISCVKAFTSHLQQLPNPTTPRYFRPNVLAHTKYGRDNPHTRYYLRLKASQGAPLTTYQPSPIFSNFGYLLTMSSFNESWILLGIGLSVIAIRLTMRIATIGIRRLAADDFLMLVAAVSTENYLLTIRSTHLP
jgi:hypothetical protein